MKRYKARYFPVDDDELIKVGDRCIDATIAPRIGLTFQGGDKWINDMGDDVILPDWQNRFKFRKVELFMCSNEIKVGDTVKSWFHSHETGSSYITATVLEIPEKYNDHDCYVLKSGGMVFDSLCKFTHKALDKISKGALTFVKDGDEFDEEEVVHHHICHDSEGNMGYCFHCQRSRGCDSTDYDYIIKGPCGHFH